MCSNNLLAIIIKKRKNGYIRTLLKYLDFSQNPLIPEFYPNFPENRKCEGSSTFFLFGNERFINTGLGFGSVPNAPVIKYLLDNYLQMEFDLKSGIFNRVCSQIETEALEEYYPAFLRNNRNQTFSDNTIMLGCGDWQEILKHYGTGTWVDGGRNYDEALKNSRKHLKFKSVIRNPKIFLFIRKYFGRKAEYVYEWLTYDFLDMGFWYWSKRLVKKVKKKLCA